MEPEVIRWIIQAVIILVLSICVHEFGHAIVAYKLGDNTPKAQGRVTLNPLSHADPIGTAAFPLISLFLTKGASMGFGWGRPVMVNPANFSRRFEMRVAHMFVALAGPMMNVILGMVITVGHLLLLKYQVIAPAEYSSRELLGVSVPNNISAALHHAASLNFILFFFNLVPAYPLDGGAVLEGFLPRKYLDAYDRFKVYGPFVLMIVILVPGMHVVFTTPATWVYEHWTAICVKLLF